MGLVSAMACFSSVQVMGVPGSLASPRMICACVLLDLFAHELFDSHSHV
jgi:hypothetical protein